VQQWQDIAAELPPQVAQRFCRPRLVSGRKRRRCRIGSRWFLTGFRRRRQGVFKLLTPDTPAHVDWLFDKSELPISELTAVLLSLEMRELVRALPGRCFVRRL
jgi:predicted Rossmann fold nucleotide-binding protein DprA/Smf involved in DNA uptake